MICSFCDTKDIGTGAGFVKLNGKEYPFCFKCGESNQVILDNVENVSIR
jgi:ribosomal protein L24E